MVLDFCMLHPELAADTHGLQVEDVNVKEVAGHLLLNPGLIPSPLHLAQFHQSSCLINLDDSCCSTIVMAHSNYSSDDIK